MEGEGGGRGVGDLEEAGGAGAGFEGVGGGGLVFGVGVDERGVASVAGCSDGSDLRRGEVLEGGSGAGKNSGVAAANGEEIFVCGAEGLDDEVTVPGGEPGVGSFEETRRVVEMEGGGIGGTGFAGVEAEGGGVGG